ncbi:hypothetical protein [Microbacterium sp. No. 7]|uniref:hypothetical protein n=1 Tax=Microbacterium sp. No. 7 TaxID=1714373 RepID=UPI0006ED28FE|nr:hypothetical protein [Microbacterium sp. No. 7]ALJ20027.1 hypothetical protein AOA12_08940 [Microbacterium sp. No. 7]
MAEAQEQQAAVQLRARRRSRRPTRRERARALAAKTPTRWFAGILTVLFLGTTAAFGGIATAEPPPLPELQPGDEHRSTQVAITPVRAVLVDDLAEAGASPADGERVLAVHVRLENAWTEPLTLYTTSTTLETISVAELAGTAPTAVSRLDDATRNPILQPRVPVDVVLAWTVPAERFADGDPLALTLNDMTLHTGSSVASGRWWKDPVPAARVTLSLTDVGTGAP